MIYSVSYTHLYVANATVKELESKKVTVDEVNEIVMNDLAALKEEATKIREEADNDGDFIIAVSYTHLDVYKRQREGKDSYIFSKSGASCVKMVSPNRVITVENLNYEESLDDVLKTMTEYDFILVEGYKWENLDRIEVYRTGYSTKIISEKDKLIAIVSDIEHNLNIDRFNPNEYEKIAEKIKDYFNI